MKVQHIIFWIIVGVISFFIFVPPKSLVMLSRFGLLCAISITLVAYFGHILMNEKGYKTSWRYINLLWWFYFLVLRPLWYVVQGINWVIDEVIYFVVWFVSHLRKQNRENW